MSKTDKKLLNINDFLPYQLVSLSTKVSNDFAHVYEQKGELTQPQWRVLSHAIQTEGLTAKHICELASMDKSTVSRAIKQLQDRQLIEMLVSPSDKRAKTIAVTEQGRVLYQALTPLALAWEAELLSCFSDEQKENFIGLLMTLQNRLANGDTSNAD
ncbi:MULTISPECIES: MarR family transcriptional regulator [Pseudoalteromonas]|uniref:MarR family winged helix-turn-helix transcriptional regulator n=1 Tax=Pseudoalteromonas TaxID=53246 RepID=UPI0019D09C1C|nr:MULTISPECIES: MarR family transcriptional regulator [Pseudoalteromonas]MBR8843481.1 MarR family transcriptional regulator [Pseudoalteromonas sp. JC3]QUI68442.1 MarR family transcriptional regulator [Pseudoalteromonas sp. M8]UDM63921.1 MarR family transcriptional regulator [Pseudoalteromonas piscicida]WJE11421.1 MarR family transcriptional regulator [Pseudoalteromonas sp. JC3]